MIQTCDKSLSSDGKMVCVVAKVVYCGSLSWLRLTVTSWDRNEPESTLIVNPADSASLATNRYYFLPGSPACSYWGAGGDSETADLDALARRLRPTGRCSGRRGNA